SPVASTTTRLTCSATSQSRSSSNALVVVAKVRISCRRDRLPFGLGVRTHALRSFLPISKAAHRSCKSSIETPPGTNELGQSAPARTDHTHLKHQTPLLSP